MVTFKIYNQLTNNVAKGKQEWKHCPQGILKWNIGFKWVKKKNPLNKLYWQWAQSTLVDILNWHMNGRITNEDDIIKLSHKFDNINHIETVAFPVPDSRFKILWHQYFKSMCQIFKILISILRIVNNFHHVFGFYNSFFT